MGIIYGKAGHIIYVKAKLSATPFTRIKEQIIRSGETLRYIGKKPEIVLLSEEPIPVTISGEHFQTADKAILNVGVKLTVQPEIESPLEKIRHCIPAYEFGNPKEWLEIRLKYLLNFLREYPLRSILDNIDEKNNSKDTIDHLQGIKNKGKLSDKLESLFSKYLNDFNFLIIKNSTFIFHDPLPPMNQLDARNPNHQSIISYLNSYKELELKLKREEDEYNSKLHELKKSYDLQMKKLEENFEKHYLDINYEFKSNQIEMEMEIEELETKVEQRRRELKIQEEKLEKEYLELKKKKELPIWAMGIYLDYKNLLFDDFSKLISSIQNIYKIFYSIKVEFYNQYDEKKITKFDEILKEIDRLIKLNFEDILYISSINTGDSIVIRFKTGWKPKIDTEKNDIILYLPHGVVVIVFMAILIGQSLNYGISNYEKILNIIKIKNEIKIQDKQLKKIDLEIKDLINKLNSENLSNNIKNNLKREFEVLLNLTAGNENINRVNIEKDKYTIEIEKLYKSLNSKISQDISK